MHCVLWFDRFDPNSVSHTYEVRSRISNSPRQLKYLFLCAAMVGQSQSQWEDVSPQEREELHQACLPGFKIWQALSCGKWPVRDIIYIREYLGDP